MVYIGQSRKKAKLMNKLLPILALLFFSCDVEVVAPAPQHGCLDSQACNYNPNASIDNNSCIYVSDECGECGGDNSTCSDTIHGCLDSDTAYGFALRSSYVENYDFPGPCSVISDDYTWEDFDLNCPEYYKELQCQIDNNQFNLTLGQQLYFYIYELDENGNYTPRNLSESFEIDVSDSNIISIEYCEEAFGWDPFLGTSHPCGGAGFMEWGNGSFASDFFLSALNVGQTTFIVKLNFDNYSEYISLPITVNVSE